MKTAGIRVEAILDTVSPVFIILEEVFDRVIRKEIILSRDLKFPKVVCLLQPSGYVRPLTLS